MPKPKRSFQTIYNDGLYPGSPMCPDPEIEGKRYQAFVDVLRTMPDEDYEVYKEKAGTLHWFIPDTRNRANVTLVHATIFPRSRKGKLTDGPHTRMVYLNPSLERAAWSIIIACVAHELAHIILGHKIVVGGEEYKQQELEAWKRVADWGYEKQARKHEAMYKRQETMGRS
ncbi:MAG: hypothetical protein ABSA16_09445 [Thermoguttaceae bacterium]